MKFEIYRDRKQQYRWRLRSRNHKIIGSSAGDGHKNKADCLKIVIAIINRTEPFVVNDLTNEKEKSEETTS